MGKANIHVTEKAVNLAHVYYKQLSVDAVMANRYMTQHYFLSVENVQKSQFEFPSYLSSLCPLWCLFPTLM